METANTTVPEEEEDGKFKILDIIKPAMWTFDEIRVAKDNAMKDHMECCTCGVCSDIRGTNYTRKGLYVPRGSVKTVGPRRTSIRRKMSKRKKDKTDEPIPDEILATKIGDVRSNNHGLYADYQYLFFSNKLAIIVRTLPTCMDKMTIAELAEVCKAFTDSSERYKFTVGINF
jgi:hypothetical protein